MQTTQMLDSSLFGLDDDGTFLLASPFLWSRLALCPLGAIVAGVHGYKRNRGDTGSTILWAALGFAFPVITNVVALVEGYGKPK